jgi:hypothetical protein
MLATDLIQEIMKFTKLWDITRLEIEMVVLILGVKA